MPTKPEYIGKSHEKLTRDLLNGEHPNEDTTEQIKHLNEDEESRVRLASEKTAEFIAEDVPFTVREAEEVGDELRGVSGDDTDLIVRGGSDERRYSLKMVSSGDANMRNPTLKTICTNMLDRSQEDFLEDNGLKEEYDEAIRRYVAEEIESRELAAVVLPALASEFRDARDRDERALRRRLRDELRVDSHTVACKVTPAGNYHGIVSTTQGPISKLRELDTDLDIYVADGNDTSVFFDIDGERAFRIDVYGQSSSGRSPGLRAACRVPVA